MKVLCCSQDQLSLDNRIESLCEQLLVNNLETGNLGTLVHVFIHYSSELLASTQTAK